MLTLRSTDADRIVLKTVIDLIEKDNTFNHPGLKRHGISDEDQRALLQARRRILTRLQEWLRFKEREDY